MKFLKAAPPDDPHAARIYARERSAAREEGASLTADLAAGFLNEVWSTVERKPAADGVGKNTLCSSA